MDNVRTHITIKAIPRVSPTTPPAAMNTSDIQLQAAIRLLERCERYIREPWFAKELLSIDVQDFLKGVR